MDLKQFSNTNTESFEINHRTPIVKLCSGLNDYFFPLPFVLELEASAEEVFGLGLPRVVLELCDVVDVTLAVAVSAFRGRFVFLLLALSLASASSSLLAGLNSILRLLDLFAPDDLVSARSPLSRAFIVCVKALAPVPFARGFLEVRSLSLSEGFQINS
jgi:hypothetical protein